MAWTKAQENVIEQRGKSLLVSAAAGSGKTSVLVERVTRLLEEGADLSRMLIVTFTNAAAGEMKERIAARLGSAVVRHSHISTFHKFAIDIIQQYYQIIGINPSLTICDEYRQSILKSEALDEMFEELFESDDEDFIYFLNHYCTPKSNKNARDMILHLYSFLCSLPNSDEFLDSLRDGSLFDEEKYAIFAKQCISESLSNSISALKQLYNLLLNPNNAAAKPMPKLASKVEEDITGLEKILSEVNSNGIDGLAHLMDFKFQRMVKTKDETPSFAFIADQFDVLRKLATDEIKGIVKEYSHLSSTRLREEKKQVQKPLSILARLTLDFTNRYQKKKQKEKLIDFSDIEHFALRILENQDVCNELKDSFDYIFVDEYQDSNLVQDELIFRIAKKDNVFLVGDVKQSIYKFRLAEPELFLNRYDAYKAGLIEDSIAIDLNSNFRSKKPIIDFINAVFERLMTKESVGISYDEDAALKEGAKYTGEYQYEPSLYLVSSSSEDEAVDPGIAELKDTELEALQAVRIIKEYHGKMVFDSKSNALRPLEYKDMVILLRSTKTKGEIYYKALEDAGIPVYLERGEGYFDTPEIQVTLNLLRIIDNFRQDVPLISVLHFPSFGFTADELARIRIFAKENGKNDLSFSDAFKYYEANSNDSLKNRCTEFLEMLNLFRAKAFAMPLPDFIWDLLSSSGIGNYARALPSGTQRFANLRALADKALSFEMQNGGGLFGFISYIELISNDDRGVETGQVTVLKEGSDTVRIMTIHKSKGLEFPFVLLAGLGSRFMSSKSGLSIALHKDLGASIRLVEPLKGISANPISLNLINKKREKEDFAEIIRVLYVAMTRAQDILVMSACVKDANEWMNKRLLVSNASYFSNYLDMIGAIFSVTNIHIVSLCDISEVLEASSNEKLILDSLDVGFKFDKETLTVSEEEIRSRVFFDYSPKANQLLKQKYSVSEITALSRPKNDIHVQASAKHKVPLFALGKRPVDAAAKGTAYHTLMQHLNFDKVHDIKDIEICIEDLVNRNLLAAEEKEVIDTKRVKAFIDSEIGQRAANAKKIYKEKPFVFKTEFEGREVFVQGTIDCYFEENGQFVLVDYKSNYIDALRLESEKQRIYEEYIPQLKLYRKALEEIEGKKVKEAYLYLFGINDIIKIC